MIPTRFRRLAVVLALALAPSLALAQATLQRPITDRTQGVVDQIPAAIAKLYANDLFLQTLIGTRFSQLGAAALLNVGTVTGTVADGGALAAEILRAQAAEQVNATAIAANATAITAETSRAQNAEALKAPLASPAFTGTPTVPTAAAGVATTQAASTAFVANAVAAAGGGPVVPPSRQILTSGLATGGGDLSADRTIAVPKATQSDVATGTDDAKALTAYSIATALGAKAPLASPTLVGTPTVPTAVAGTNTTQAASTAFVTGALGSYLTTSAASATYAPLASPALTGNPTAPTQAAADNSTKLATTAYADRAAAFVAAAVPVTPPVRQTVLSGPSASGAPSLLPATTSGTLTLTAQGVSSTVLLVVTAAQGGTSNTIYTFTSNPSWTLPPSSTAYLFVNGSTGATSVQTLAPIYQFGGTISTANGQFTFDYQAMVGYLGNGTTAVATPLVAVGEAVTSSTAVTSTIAYAYQGQYESSWTTPLPSNVTTVQHNLGIQPRSKKIILECVAADAGYAVGDQISTDAGAMVGNASYTYAVALPSTRLAVTYIPGSTTAWTAANKSNGAVAGLTLASWRYRWVAQRGW